MDGVLLEVSDVVVVLGVCVIFVKFYVVNVVELMFVVWKVFVKSWVVNYKEINVWMFGVSLFFW